MAYVSSNAADRSGNVVVNALSAFGNWLISISESSEKARRIEALSNMSDAELAARGLKREDIARHVFRDHYYV
ncbi:DUF1127 domain-containing protein [Pseudaestuariivita sp.]|uniref:DUF1127 domain-containing protein n=1 Tax=Pseudaestuariivita sp. TaxID=2211669 RepID=UPI004059D1C9